MVSILSKILCDYLPFNLFLICFSKCYKKRLTYPFSKTRKSTKRCHRVNICVTQPLKIQRRYENYFSIDGFYASLCKVEIDTECNLFTSVFCFL